MSSTQTALSFQQLQDLAAGREPIEAHIMELLGTMQDSNEEMRALASDALETIASIPPNLADTIAEKCLSPNAPLAAWACKLLAKLGGDATRYQSAIVACLNEHPILSVRQQAALSLASIPGLEPAAITALRHASESDDPRLKRLATAALSAAGA